MTPGIRRTFHLLACVLISCSSLTAQDNVRSGLFADADRVLTQAREKQANLYAPTNFGKGMEAYREADDDFKRGRNLEDIRTKLREATSWFNRSIEACKLAEVTFSRVMAARTDALSADAPKYANELWMRAEALFTGAAKELEDGDVNDAKKESGEAETLYRNGELEAIKGNYLAPARELLKRANDMDAKDNAPKTMQKAVRLSTQVENMLKQNRYDTDEARQVAQEAKYEASHAIHLHQRINQIRKEDKTDEDIILASEDALRSVAAALEIHAAFDTGLEPAAASIVAEVNKRKQKAAQDAASIRQQENEIANLKQQVASMEGRLGTLSETEKSLQDKLNKQRKQEETIAQVGSSFSTYEASVVRDGNNIVIRLYGLTFPVGRNTIEPQFFPLLTKVQDAIKRFPGCQVAIEGHTDSQGSDETNQRLSDSRAEAVATYLRANLGTVVPMTYQGYGESKPVASNDVAEGRARNRRIDIVIVPEWAIVGR
jgi:outer membrane protein OmpA-like peptidoglycan-associated protein